MSTSRWQPDKVKVNDQDAWFHGWTVINGAMRAVIEWDQGGLPLCYVEPDRITFLHKPDHSGRYPNN